MASALAPGAQRSIDASRASSLASRSASLSQVEVGEAERRGLAPVEPRAGQGEAPREALAEPGDEMGRDLGRRNAEARLGEREARALGRDDDVGGGGEAHAAADRRAVDYGDRHIRQRGEAGEEAPASGVERLQGIGLARLGRRRQSARTAI